MYLSLTDYVQHKYAPAEPEARRFYQELDARFGRLAALGAIVALTADHGMNDKSNADGKPNVIWLQDILDAKFGKGDTRVICPITDAFVAHHGALGGFVRVWCRGKATPREIIDAIRGLDGHRIGARQGDRLPRARPAGRPRGATSSSSRRPTSASARSEADHDLSGLEGHRLRTHGGVSEAKVPFILSRAAQRRVQAQGRPSRRSKSYQIFDFAINGTAPA